MNYSDYLNDLAAAIHSACLRDLPDIKYLGNVYRKPTKAEKANCISNTMVRHTAPMQRRPERRDIGDVLLWTQMWGSTALGFGGIGGAAMTTATAIVIFGHNRQGAAVYFGGRFAYYIARPNIAFHEACAKHWLHDVAGSSKRYEEATP